MGDAQEAWLKHTLDKSRAKWNIIANQVLMARIDRKPGPEEALSMDQWSGYEVCRDRMMRFLAERKPSNPVVITGDIHSNWVSDLKVDWKNENSPVVATEFVGTSISSGGDGADEQPATAAWYRENPHLKMYNSRRGYVLVTVTEAQCRADYRIVPFVTKPEHRFRRIRVGWWRTAGGAYSGYERHEHVALRAIRIRGRVSQEQVFAHLAGTGGPS